MVNWKGGVSKSAEYRANRLKNWRHKKGISVTYYNGDKSKYRSHGIEYPILWCDIRKEIYKRDNWTCQECGVKCHNRGTKNKIQCPHIDYNIHNVNSSNLITLCASCHCKTNFRRDDWKIYFNNKIRNQINENV